MLFWTGNTTDEKTSRANLLRMTWPQSMLFLLIFRALLKMKKDLKCTFISFSSFDNSKKGTPGVFFQLFSDSDNVKRLSSTCHFGLVKLNELISTQYKFNPFPDWDRLFTKKEYHWLNMTKEVLSDIILHFFRIWETNLRKSNYGVLFCPLFQTL